MNSNSICIGVIGCGRVAGHHCSSVSRTEGVELVAVSDLDEQRARAYGEKYKVPHFISYHDMLENLPNIDVVAIITPSGMHAEHATEVLNQYEKHIVVEKPTFMTSAQMRNVYEIAKLRNCQIFPVFQNRYNKAVKCVKSALLAGDLGDIRLVNVRLRWCRPQRYYDLSHWRGTFSHDGGALTNQTIHHIDLLRYLGGEVDEVNATMRTLGADIEVEDTTVATLKYQSGAVGSLESTTAARPDDFEASISIVGSKGLAQIGGIAVNELQIFTPDPSQCGQNSEDFQSITGHGAVYGFGHQQLYADVRNHLTKRGVYPVDRGDCEKTLSLLHAFYVSDEVGKWVKVGPEIQSSRLGRPNDDISALYRTPLV
mgnify:CR=1 FL=1